MAVDPTYITKNYEQQGGAVWVIGGQLQIAPGGSITFGAGNTPMSGAVIGGARTVLPADVTATNVTIPTGLTTAILSTTVSIMRSGRLVAADAGVAQSTISGVINLVITSGSSYSLTANDIINWTVVGS